MSTIVSPRPSLTLSSRRTSTSTDVTGRSPSTSRAPTTATTRRNRAALREFYGLKDKDTATGESSTPARGASAEEKLPESELDKPGFDAEQYVKEMLAKEGLEGILKVEAGLVSGESWKVRVPSGK